MKRTILLIFQITLLFNTYAQEGNITVEDIWKDYKFYGETVRGINWMNDGKYYSELIE